MKRSAIPPASRAVDGICPVVLVFWMTSSFPLNKMRFRSKIINSIVLYTQQPQPLRSHYTLSSMLPITEMSLTMEKLAKVFIVRLTPEFIQFLVAKDGGVGLQAFAKLDNETLFQDHLIESLNNNEIWLQANGEHLSRALKCATGAVPSQHAVAVRLTKKQGMPVLCFVVTTTGRTGKPIQLVQDCPVRPLTAAQTEELREPVVPNPDVHIMLPPVMAMKNMADRMKAISGHLIVKANMSGDFIMQVQNDLVELETFYEDLENPTIDPSQVEPSQQPSLNRDPKQFADVRIDIRDFIKFCTCHQLNPMHTICCIIENHGLVFYVYIGENGGENIGDARGCGTITYYIPCRIA